MSFVIRPATLDDAPALQAIYAPFVTDTAISFEYIPPSVSEFAARMEKTLESYPYFVAELDGKPVGYAYAGHFIDRAAYDHTAELTVYLSPAAQKKGVGKALYTALENALREKGIKILYACIGVTETEDEYLTNNSRDFHAHLGFKTVGAFKDSGFKFDRYYDMIYMEKRL